MVSRLVDTETVAGATVHRCADAAQVADVATRFVADRIRLAIDARGACRLALSGGRTPEAMYERLASKEFGGAIEWTKVVAFFGDERMVPPDDASSNYRMARNAFLDRVPIPAENVHRIEGELEPRVAAERYATILGVEPLDLVLLGMGDDGHVASLFPCGPELEQTGKTATSYAPVAPHSRVSITFPVIDAARIVTLLVTGSSKSVKVQQVFEERQSRRPTLPAARVSPRSGELHWFLDAAAASLLS